MLPGPPGCSLYNFKIVTRIFSNNHLHATPTMCQAPAEHFASETETAPTAGKRQGRAGGPGPPTPPHLPPAPVGGAFSRPCSSHLSDLRSTVPPPSPSTSHPALHPLNPFPSDLPSPPQLFPVISVGCSLSPCPRSPGGRVPASRSQPCSCVRTGLVVPRTPVVGTRERLLSSAGDAGRQGWMGSGAHGDRAPNASLLSAPLAASASQSAVAAPAPASTLAFRAAERRHQENVSDPVP